MLMKLQNSRCSGNLFFPLPRYVRSKLGTQCLKSFFLAYYPTHPSKWCYLIDSSAWINAHLSMILSFSLYIAFCLKFLALAVIPALTYIRPKNVFNFCAISISAFLPGRMVILAPEDFNVRGAVSYGAFI